MPALKGLVLSASQSWFWMKTNYYRPSQSLKEETVNCLMLHNFSFQFEGQIVFSAKLEMLIQSWCFIFVFSLHLLCCYIIMVCLLVYRLISTIFLRNIWIFYKVCGKRLLVISERRHGTTNIYLCWLYHGVWQMSKLHIGRLNNSEGLGKNFKWGIFYYLNIY